MLFVALGWRLSGNLRGNCVRRDGSRCIQWPSVGHVAATATASRNERNGQVANAHTSQGRVNRGHIEEDGSDFAFFMSLVDVEAEARFTPRAPASEGIIEAEALSTEQDCVET